jgi:DNA repair protein RecN (Recombination protein N)
MLQLLRIKNLALLDEISLDFETGFTAVTGETGAGKSILLGALRLLSGARVGKSVIRQGADSCEIEGALHLAEPERVDALLAEMGLPPCEDGVLLLKRVLPREKMARISVNGSLTTLANLVRLGELWIDFHGPEDPQRLFQPAFQLDLLDLYARNCEVMAAYDQQYDEWKTLRERREELAGEGQLSEEEIEFFRNQVSKIDQCEVSEESIEELERSFNRLSRGQELIEVARALADGLTGDDGVFFKLGEMQRVGRNLEEIDPTSAPLLARLVSLSVEAEDLGQELDRLAGECDFDEEEIERVTVRMNLWQEIRRKMGGSVEAVLEKRRQLADRLEQQGDVVGSLAKLDRQIATTETSLRATAAKVLAVRREAATQLGREAGKAIASLGFLRAGFEVEVTPEEKLSANGGSRCQFLFSPNAGQLAAPLHKIASSGEIARVMLALKTVLAGVDRTPVLVFDEVDANVGGEIGRIVGQRMAELGGGHQVFCVTHLPQVASLAQSHWVVEKQQDESRTSVTISPLHDSVERRVDELARMLGDRHAKSARAHATELLAG